ncbi:thioesterase family protein [Aminobacter sp. J15]|uniref:acyl-CoA thioesterase n=1 Tax=Aminobacter sp. J15 TaxID=935260 RepID=UPI0011A2691B|nr:thioesterase family protein [Aminobacter sp. J15]TWH30231.1 acyl-CoA thioester hydrolase [Aminobacter sp. J15]
MAEQRVPTTRDEYRVFRTLTTRWLDNDIYGHMNNVVHYSLFDTAVNGWLIEHRLLDSRYYSELAFPDVVTAGIRVAHIGNSSVRYEVGLFRNDEVRAAADGFFVHVYVDRETRKPVPLAPAFRAALDTLQQ